MCRETRFILYGSRRQLVSVRGNYRNASAAQQPLGRTTWEGDEVPVAGLFKHRAASGYSRGCSHQAASDMFLAIPSIGFSPEVFQKLKRKPMD